MRPGSAPCLLEASGDGGAWESGRGGKKYIWVLQLLGAPRTLSCPETTNSPSGQRLLAHLTRALSPGAARSRPRRREIGVSQGRK